MITPYEFWYDGVQRRFLQQIIRAFSGFQYQPGSVAGATPQTLMVPCRMATSNRMIASIMANNSENTLQTVPLITVYQTGLRGRREDLQNPTFVDHLQVVERKIINGVYTPLVGNSYSVDRIMPVPFTMEVNVDLWTSNMEQKYMLCEQMLAVCYPQFQIQNSDNGLDWTAVSICFVDDEIAFTSQTIPVGESNSIDILTLKLRLPIWLSAPAAVREMNRIEEVVANVNTGDLAADGRTLDSGSQLSRVLVTPKDYFIAVDGPKITLLLPHGVDAAADGTKPTWLGLFELMGRPFHALHSALYLYESDDIEGPYVSGVLQYGQTEQELVWTIDPTSLPANTLDPINGVIDPVRTFAGNGLPDQMEGDRYLLLSDIGPSLAWPGLTAHEHDIIEFSHGNWSVSFHPHAAQPQYVLNLFTSAQLRWNGNEWLVTLDGLYGPGLWRLVF